jgi:hypothetical protein
MNRPTGPWCLAACAFLACATAGCRSIPSGGEVDVQALGAAPLELRQEFAEGVFTRLPSEESYWFSDIALEGSLDRFVAEFAEAGAERPSAAFLHAQLVWTPEPGKTPLDADATNLVLRLVIVSKGEVGIYGGAAFATPSGGDGEPRSLAIEGGTLTLLEKTAGFHDLLSPARLSGTLTARLDDGAASRWRRALSQFATNALGRPTWVRLPDSSQDRLASR